MATRNLYDINQGLPDPADIGKRF